ncbi:unnamed protein product [Phytophthora lilii]|uniref:Unnamed protein product n=1 Tax=Phytophthora lilii TaxID=2077276 RepID=A0A9W6XC04_9STRA|nr:unnamed protein product [Phytophthora lilii]
MASSREPKHDAPRPFKRLKLSNLPLKLVISPDVLELIDELLMSPEEAVTKAAQTTKVEWLDELLCRFNCDVSAVAVAAATNGSLSVVRVLVAKIVNSDKNEGFPVDAENDGRLKILKDAAIASAGAGHVDILKLLVFASVGPPTNFNNGRNPGSFEPSNVFGNAVIAAAKADHVDVLRLMLPEMIAVGDEEVSEPKDEEVSEPVSFALMDAAKHGALRVVEFLLPKLMKPRCYGDNRYHFMTWAILEAAAANGHLAIVKFATAFATERGFKDTYAVHDTNYADLLLLVVKNGYTDILLYLVDQHCVAWSTKRVLKQVVELQLHALAKMVIDIYKRPVKCLFLELIQDKSIETVQFLYDNGYVDTASINEAFELATKMESAQTVEFLIKTGKVSSDAFAKAFEDAAFTGSITILIQLHSTKRAAPNIVCTAFDRASDFACVKYLYESEREQIPVKSVIASFKTAGSYEFLGGRYGEQRYGDHINILKLLVHEKCISDELVSEVFLRATKNHDIAVLQCLLNDHRVTPEAKNEAFQTAGLQGYSDIVQLLHKEKHISVESTSTVWVNAAKYGYTDIVNVLAPQPNMPEDMEAQAFIAAAQHGQVRVLKMLSISEEWPVAVVEKALSVSNHEQVKTILQEKLSN